MKRNFADPGGDLVTKMCCRFSVSPSPAGCPSKCRNPEKSPCFSVGYSCLYWIRSIIVTASRGRSFQGTARTSKAPVGSLPRGEFHRSITRQNPQKNSRFKDTHNPKPDLIEAPSSFSSSSMSPGRFSSHASGVIVLVGCQEVMRLLTDHHFLRFGSAPTFVHVLMISASNRPSEGPPLA